MSDSRVFHPIGVWFEGRPDWAGSPAEPAAAAVYYDRCFADLAAHGVNAAVVTNTPVPLRTTILAAADRQGLRIVLDLPEFHPAIRGDGPIDEAAVRAEARKTVQTLGVHDSLLAYQIYDEPENRMVRNWLAVRDIFAELDPVRPPFSCFCRAESLGLVTARTDLPQAVFDIYPLRPDTLENDLTEFDSTLAAFRDAARCNPMWVVLQSFAKKDFWRYPTFEELLAMADRSLTAGAEGLFFFLYQSLPNHPEQLEGLLDNEGRETPLYRGVGEAASELQRRLNGA
ncbi:MAG: hypothetical protein GXY33_18675 [Phycisphaerae bacterium]|nr:hypothetical protein [Phycisphaerae bacterium]